MEPSHEIFVGIALLLAGGTATLLGKIVFDWLKQSRKPLDQNGKLMKYVRCPLDRSNTIDAIKWLRDVHDVKDSSGLPLWYIPRGMESAMNKVAEETTKQNVTLQRIAGLLSTNGVKLDTLIKNGHDK